MEFQSSSQAGFNQEECRTRGRERGKSGPFFITKYNRAKYLHTTLNTSILNKRKKRDLNTIYLKKATTNETGTRQSLSSNNTHSKATTVPILYNIIDRLSDIKGTKRCRGLRLRPSVTRYRRIDHFHL